MTEWFIVKWLFAFSPIAVVLVLMIFFNWSGSRAGAAAWLTALIVGVGLFGAHPELLAYSQMKGVLLSLNVLYIIWAALLLYNVVNETGAIKAIGIGIERFSGDKSIQLLIFGWIFSSFLQGVAGYGVPIAVVAPLLVGLGFSPVVAVAVPAIGHSWSVTFGSMGASFQAMMAVTGLSSEFLGAWAAVLLGVAAYLCGICAVHVFGGWKMIKHSAVALLVIGTVMAGDPISAGHCRYVDPGWIWRQPDRAGSLSGRGPSENLQSNRAVRRKKRHEPGLGAFGLSDFDRNRIYGRHVRPVAGFSGSG